MAFLPSLLMTQPRLQVTIQGYVFHLYIFRTCSKHIFKTIDHFLLRKGAADNVMVFPRNDYDSSGSFTLSNGTYSIVHKAYGADLFRYSWNYGRNWTDWKAWENRTIIDGSIFSGPSLFWPGDHIQIQCKPFPFDNEASLLRQVQQTGVKPHSPQRI